MREWFRRTWLLSCRSMAAKTDCTSSDASQSCATCSQYSVEVLAVDVSPIREECEMLPLTLLLPLVPPPPPPRLGNFDFLAVLEANDVDASRLRSVLPLPDDVDDDITLLFTSSRPLEVDDDFEPNANISLPWCGAPILDFPVREPLGLLRSMIGKSSHQFFLVLFLFYSLSLLRSICLRPSPLFMFSDLSKSAYRPSQRNTVVHTE